MIKFLKGTLFGVALASIALTSFFLAREKNKSEIIAKLEEQLATPLPSVKPIEDIKEETISRTNLQAAILTSLATKNYQLLENYLAEKVFFVIQRTECCGDLAVNEVVDQLTVLDTAKPPWIFDKTIPELKNLAENYPEAMGENYIVGKSENDMVVSFGITDENKIENIRILNKIDDILM